MDIPKEAIDLQEAISKYLKEVTGVEKEVHITQTQAWGSTTQGGKSYLRINCLVIEKADAE